MADVGLRRRFTQEWADIEQVLLTSPLMALLASRSGYPARFIAGWILCLCPVVMGFTAGRAAVEVLAFWLYPAHATLKALSVASGAEGLYEPLPQGPALPAATAHWLRYWVLFGFLRTVEFVGAPVLSRVPFYETLRLGAAIQLYDPAATAWLFRRLLPRARPLLYRLDLALAQLAGLAHVIAHVFHKNVFMFVAVAASAARTALSGRPAEPRVFPGARAAEPPAPADWLARTAAELDPVPEASDGVAHEGPSPGVTEAVGQQPPTAVAPRRRGRYTSLNSGTPSD